MILKNVFIIQAYINNISISSPFVKGIIGDYTITDYLCTPSESPLYLPLSKRGEKKLHFSKSLSPSVNLQNLPKFSL